MSPRPTRSIEPLLPEPGRFDQVLREARARRTRRAAAASGVAGVFLAGIMGGLALGGVGKLQDVVVTAANRLDPQPTASPESSTTATPNTGTTAPQQQPTKNAGASGPAGPPLAMVRGKAVDSTGAPVVDAYVYAGYYQGDDFVPSAPVARTGPAGGFTVPCEQAVLLTPWPLNGPLEASGSATFAATTITAPACSSSTQPQVTMMLAGGTIEGQVRTDVGCAGEDFRGSLWLDGSRTTAVWLGPLHEGDSFQITGVPAGEHVLFVHGQQYAVTVPSAGETVTRNVTVACTAGPAPTEIPSLTPTPAQTPSETTSPSPPETSSAPASPSPSATGQRN